MRKSLIVGILSMIVVIGVLFAAVVTKQREIHAQFELIADEQEAQI